MDDNRRAAITLDPRIRFLTRYKRLIGVIVLLAVLLLAFQMSGMRDHLDLAFLRELILRHRLGGLLLFVLLFAVGNLVQIPGWIFLAAAVLTLGRVWGGAVTYLAAMVSCALTFLAIRALGGDALRLIENRLALKILRRLDEHPVGSVALLRVLFQTMPAMNYALAMSGIGFRQYMLGTAVGLPLPIALYCIFFDVMAKALHIA